MNGLNDIFFYNPDDDKIRCFCCGYKNYREYFKKVKEIIFSNGKDIEVTIGRMCPRCESPILITEKDYENMWKL